MTPDQVISVLPAWGDLRFLRQLEGGYRNTVLLVERGNELLVAKSTRRSASGIDWLQDLYPRVETAGLVMPRFVPSLQGRLVEGGVTVEQWIDGAPLAATHFPAAKQAMRRLHGATRHWPQRPGFASSQELLSRTQGGDVDLELMPADLISVCREAWATLSGQSQSVVHGDINPNNVLVTRDDHIALIDWDEARVDVSAFDLATLIPADETVPAIDPIRLRRALEAWEVAVCWQVEPEHAKTMARHLMESRNLGFL